MEIKIGKQTELVALYSVNKGTLLFPFSDVRQKDQNNCLLGDKGVNMNGCGTLEDILKNNRSCYKPIYKGDEITIKF